MKKKKLHKIDFFKRNRFSRSLLTFYWLRGVLLVEMKIFIDFVHIFFSYFSSLSWIFQWFSCYYCSNKWITYLGSINRVSDIYLILMYGRRFAIKLYQHIYLLVLYAMLSTYWDPFLIIYIWHIWAIDCISKLPFETYDWIKCIHNATNTTNNDHWISISNKLVFHQRLKFLLYFIFCLRFYCYAVASWYPSNWSFSKQTSVQLFPSKWIHFEFVIARMHARGLRWSHRSNKVVEIES